MFGCPCTTAAAACARGSALFSLKYGGFANTTSNASLKRNMRENPAQAPQSCSVPEDKIGVDDFDAHRHAFSCSPSLQLRQDIARRTFASVGVNFVPHQINTTRGDVPRQKGFDRRAEQYPRPCPRIEDTNMFAGDFDLLGHEISDGTDVR